VALENPHGLDPTLVSTCGRFFVTSGGTCSEAMDLRLSHAESRCLGVQAEETHSIAGVSCSVSAGAPAGCWNQGRYSGHGVTGDVTIAGHQPWSVVVDVKNFNLGCWIRRGRRIGWREGMRATTRSCVQQRAWTALVKWEGMRADAAEVPTGS
jgi:hypothetical protein